MGFEPTTFCLGSKHSTTELHPPGWVHDVQSVCHTGAATARPAVSTGRRVDPTQWQRVPVVIRATSPYQASGPLDEFGGSRHTTAAGYSHCLR